jgi:hypothetical protein
MLSLGLTTPVSAGPFHTYTVSACKRFRDGSLVLMERFTRHVDRAHSEIGYNLGGQKK